MMQTKSEKIKTQTIFRHFAVEKRGIDEEKRTAEIAFSSEAPYERWFGTEILDHGAKSIRLDRLKDGGAVLLNHNTERHVGIVEQVTVGDDRIGRAVVRFSRNAEADAAFKDVQDGILKHVSVGYLIHRMVMEEEKDGHETYRVTDWEPIEVSMVPIPADPTVGVGRNMAAEIETEVIRKVAEPETQTERKVNITMEKSAEEIENARRTAIRELGKQYAKYVTDADVLDAVMDGARTVDKFRDLIMQKMESKHTDTSGVRIGLTQREVQRYSICRAIAAHMSGNWKDAGFEREASEAVAKMMGRSPEGFYVPYDAFQRDFNVGTGTEAGNLVATDLRGDLYVDALRNNLVLAKLGIRILAGLTSNVDMPRKSTASTVGMVTEIAAASETNPLTSKVTLSPKRMGAYVEYSKQAIIQASMGIEAMLRDDLLQSAAVLIQDQVINGVGTGANMRGIRNTSGIGAVIGGTNGLAIAWSHLVDLESACANVNAEPDKVSGYLVNTKTRGSTKKTQKGTNLPFIWDQGEFPLNGYRAAVTNSVPSNLTKGTSTTICSSVLFGSDWSMSVLGLFGAPDITVDPFTLAKNGQVVITLNQYADHGCRLPAAFATMEDALAN